jgi:Zn finger protein HypA/HybF involved in hydrogenase expression
MNKIKIYFDIACNKAIFIKSLKIALIVGTILNLINQGDKLLTLDIDIFKSILTYIVPFIVSTYTAISLKLSFNIGDMGLVDAKVMCKNCKNTMQIEKNHFIPVCENCNEKTKWKIIGEAN